MNDTANGLIETLEDGVAVLTLNAPARRNALSTEIRLALLAAMQKYIADSACRAIVLTGAAQTFCAGGDISQMTPPAGMTPRDYSMSRMKALHDCVRLIAAGPKPVVAAVEGHAAGAGMSLAAACDYVVAAEDSRFVASFGKIGLAADCGLLWSLPHRVGHAKARDLLLTARAMSGPEAQQIGLADEVVARGGTLAAAIRKAKSYATTAPLAIALTKRVMAGELDNLDVALDSEIEWQAELRATADHQEARDAFLQKRPPVFQGR